MTTKKISCMSDNSLDFLEKMTGKKMTLGNFIWSIRECEEMNQVEFAKLLGISRQYLCDIEHNRRTVSTKAAADFANKLGYSALHFIRLAIQDELNKSGFHLNVQINEERKAA
jgi:transcriptional regulator with XRE-family HTH domain